MKLTRAQFLKALPAAALALAGCTAPPPLPIRTSWFLTTPTRWTMLPSLLPTATRTALPC